MGDILFFSWTTVVNWSKVSSNATCVLKNSNIFCMQIKHFPRLTFHWCKLTAFLFNKSRFLFVLHFSFENFPSTIVTGQSTLAHPVCWGPQSQHKNVWRLSDLQSERLAFSQQMRFSFDNEKQTSKLGPFPLFSCQTQCSVHIVEQNSLTTNTAIERFYGKQLCWICSSPLFFHLMNEISHAALLQALAPRR